MDIPGMTAKRRVEQSGDGYIVYVKPPDFFGQAEVAVRLTAEQYDRYQQWRAGAGQIQELLYDLDSDEREKLLSGLTDESFMKAWPEE
jgi:hypothetical protein